MKKSRAELAGIKLGKSIIEMINLMYNNNTATNFITGICNTLNTCIVKRMYSESTPIRDKNGYIIGYQWIRNKN